MFKSTFNSLAQLAKTAMHSLPGRGPSVGEVLAEYLASSIRRRARQHGLTVNRTRPAVLGDHEVVFMKFAKPMGREAQSQALEALGQGVMAELASLAPSAVLH
jgi:hypothetical protein